MNGEKMSGESFVSGEDGESIGDVILDEGRDLHPVECKCVPLG